MLSESNLFVCRESERRSLSQVQLFVIPWTVAHQIPLSWNSPGRNTGVGCHFILQVNPGLLRCRQILYHPNHQGGSACRGLTVFGDGDLQEVKVKVTHSCQTLCSPMQSMQFCRPEYWSGEPFPSPGDLPNPGIELRSPTLQVDSLPAELLGKPLKRR